VQIDLTSMKLLGAFEAREIQRQSRRVKLAVFVEGLATIAENTKLVAFYPMRVIKTWNAVRSDVFAMEVPDEGGILGWQTSSAAELATLLHQACELLLKARQAHAERVSKRLQKKRKGERERGRRGREGKIAEEEKRRREGGETERG
jgi:hypothetical protein